MAATGAKTGGGPMRGCGRLRAAPHSRETAGFMPTNAGSLRMGR
jgi:hypothetical protein